MNLPGATEQEPTETSQRADTQLVEAEPLTEEAAANLRLLNNPYVPDAPRRRVAVMTAAKKRKFCEAIANGVSPTSAAKALGVARSTVYYQRTIDPQFAEAWAEAQERDADRYEDALDHLANKSRNVGAVIFGLKNKRPEKWKDRHDLEVNRNPASDPLAAIGTLTLQEITRRFLRSQQSALPQGEEEGKGENGEPDTSH